MPIKVAENIEDDVVSLYNDGYSVTELSDKYKLHRCTIQRILKRNNIELRKRTPARYNIHFFDDYNVNSCYWAGFIAADGYIRSDRANVSIHLSNADIDHLRKLEKLTDYVGKTTVYENECCLSFAGKWFQDSLANNFGIHPRKTFNIQISDKIPEDMLPHFLRGYMDGDGSIVKIGDYLRVNFTSGSNMLLTQISDYMYNIGIRVHNKSNRAEIQRKSYSISYSCNNALKILDLLYSDSTDLTRLDRKYEIYLQYKMINKGVYKNEEDNCNYDGSTDVADVCWMWQQGYV